MLLTNKIYEGNLFMRYSKHLTYAERMFLRARLNRVRHITLDPDGPGVVRIHLVPCYKPDRETPFTAILNGQDILPLNVSWAILLTNLIVLPIATFLVPCGLISIALGGSTAGVLFSKITWFLAWAMNHSVEWIEHLPGSTVSASVNGVMVGIYYLLLLFLYAIIAKKRT